MLAVGLNETEASEYLAQADEPVVVVACVNSPHSVTLSGSKKSLDKIAALLDADNVFQGSLRVSNAYHSLEMQSIADEYAKAIADIEPLAGSGSVMFSSVTGEKVEPGSVDASYWITNMLNKVQFTAATPVQQIITQEEEKTKQDCSLSYHNILSRGRNSVEAALDAAGQLWVAGHPVNLARVNQPNGSLQIFPPITDLPYCPWNHSERNKYWHETPIARKMRLPAGTRNDFLGTPDTDNMKAPEYRKVLRLEEQPWIAEHEVQGVVVLPATAFIVMALEAAVKSAAEGQVAERIELRDVAIGRPLLFQDKSKPAETRVVLRPHKTSTRGNTASWIQVTVTSRSVMDDSWIEHANCYFIIHYKKQPSEVEGISEQLRENKSYQDAYQSFKKDCTVRYSASSVYLLFDDCGFKYGPLFKNLDELYCGKHVKDSTGSELKGYTSYELLGDHEILAQITLGAGDFEKPLVTMKGVHFREVAGGMDINIANADQAKPIATALKWKVDVDLLSPDALQQVLSSKATSSQGASRAHEIFLELVDLQSFKDPFLTVLELGCNGPEMAASTVARLTDLGRHVHIDKYIVSRPSGKPEWAIELIKKQGGVVDYLLLDLEKSSGEDGESATATKANSIVSFSGLFSRENVGVLAKRANDLLHPSGKLSFTMEIQEGIEAARAELDAVLKQVGFYGVNALIGLDPNSAFITTTKLREDKPIAEREVLFVEPSQQDNRVLRLMEKLEKDFTAAGHTISRATLETLPDTEGKAIVSFIGLGNSTLDQMTESEFEAWRIMMLKHSGLMWVSAGAVSSGKDPRRAMDTGLLRVVRSEEAALRIVQFDFSEAMDLASTQAATLLSDAARPSLFPDIHETIVETEITERDGKLFVPRLFTEQAANEAIYYHTHHPAARQQRIGDCREIMKMHVGQPGMLDTLRFEENKKLPKTLEKGQAKVRVQATPINFVDIMVAMSMVPAACLGCECSGIVEEIHADGRFKVGDQVVVMTGNAFATHVIEHEAFMQPIPQGMTPEAAASCATIYVTAYIALMDVARIQKDESILIHAGAGGLGQAAIQLARMVGAEVFVTVGSVGKKTLLMERYGIAEDHIFNSRDLTFAQGIMRQTEGRGVDVILNSTSGEALRQTWHCIAQFGRFLEVGKRDIMTNTGLDMMPFLKNASYSGVHIDQMVGTSRQRVAVAMQKVFDLFQAGKIGEVYPVTVMTYSEIEEAFRLVQTGTHTGKVVLTQSDDDIVPVIPPITHTADLKGDVTYVIAGGLGGAGQSMVDRMFDCGARNFAFFSRSGDSKPEAAEYLARLGRRSANVKAYKADIANLEALTVVYNLLEREMPPVKGFVNAAMFLQDALLAKMTYEQWKFGIAPKVIGHWNFRNLLPKGLDFFVSMSSISAMIGVPGHANYAAANTYEDAFAFWRRSQGEEAISFNLSAIFGVGVMEHSGVEKSAWYEMISLNGTEMNILLGFAMTKTTLKDVPCPTQLTTGVNPQMLNVPSMHWALDPKFRILRRLGCKRSISSDDEGAKSKLHDELRECTTMPAVTKVIEENLVLELSKSMMCNPEDINASKPLHSFRVDSLVADEVRSWIFKELKSEVTVFDIMDPQPLTTLYFKIAERAS
ncbi:lovastatin nonaketide synthase [Lecanosticta acicola]|uniref:Lovastatin nonaketide synthase n=1 Tax=Lecanosticta acicola TaxID=111012 RepID=A0AAI8YRK3_9PEZI|nr:lovastatin nonaketide synthase [Lecanosticta acicola]